MNQVSTRRAGAGVAVGALVTSALLFTPSAQAATTVTDVRESQIAKSGTPYASGYHHEGAGTFRVINEGLELVGDSAFVRGYTNNVVDTANPLDGKQTNVADLKILDDSTITGTGNPQLRVSVFSDKVADNGPTTLTPVAAPDGLWTSSEAIDAADAGTDVVANVPTSIDTIAAAIGDKYRVQGFGVFNTTGTAVVSELLFDDHRYQFKNNAPVAADRTLSTKVNTAVAVPLTASDVDGNELTYTVDSVVGGAVTGSGATQTFTPAKNFKGNGSVKYTVTDGRGGSATATVTVNVDKAKGRVDIYRIHPTKASVRSTVYVYASISVDGGKAKQGTTVYVYAKGKKVGTAKVNSSSKVKVKLPNKLPAGNATLKVTQVGSSTLIGDSDSIKIKVRK